jgi:hypothetical protein
MVVNFFFHIDYASLLFLTKNRNESSTFSIIVKEYLYVYVVGFYLA